MVAHAGPHGVNVCDGGMYRMAWVKSDRRPVDNLGGRAYACSGSATGGWGVHQAYAHDCSAASPEEATREHMWPPNGETYRCYFDCVVCARPAYTPPPPSPSPPSPSPPPPSPSPPSPSPPPPSPPLPSPPPPSPPVEDPRLGPACGTDLRAHIQALVDDATLKQASETTVQLKACDYKWSVTRSGVNFSPGTKVKISGAGKALTRVVSPLGGELSAGSDPTSSARCKAIWLQGYGDERDAESNGKKNTMENLGHANGEGRLFETNLGCPTGHNDESCPVLTSVTLQDLTITGFVSSNAIMQIGDGFHRFARVTFAENAGQLAYLASYTPDDIQPTDAVQFDQVTFVNNTGLDHLLNKRSPFNHWHFNDCEYDDNTYCGSQATYFRQVYTPEYRTPEATDWGTIISHYACKCSSQPGSYSAPCNIDSQCCSNQYWCASNPGLPTVNSVHVQGNTFIDRKGNERFGP